MKEKISSKIKELVGKNNLSNLSERTIDTYVEEISGVVTDETQLTDSFFDSHLKILKSINGQMYSDVKLQVENYKKGITGQPQQPQPLSIGMGELQKKIEMLAEGYQKLEGHLEMSRKKEQRTELIKRASDLLKQGEGGKDIDLDNLDLDYSYLKIQNRITDEMTAEQVAQLWKPVYEDIHSQRMSITASPFASIGVQRTGSDTSKIEASRELIKKYVESKEI